jgi:hypothetical protein
MRKDEDEATTATWMQQPLHMELTHLSLCFVDIMFRQGQWQQQHEKRQGHQQQPRHGCNNRYMELTHLSLCFVDIMFRQGQQQQQHEKRRGQQQPRHGHNNRYTWN